MREVFSYRRVSSNEQEKNGSLDAQRDGNNSYAMRRDMNIIQEFEDVETAGKSGRSDFNRMIKEAKKKNTPKIILVEKTDRLTRNFYDMVLIDDLINQYGIEFHLVKAGRVLGPNMGRSEKTAWSLEVLIAKDFLDNLKEETKKGIVQKVKSGGWCWGAPYGYKMVKGELVIDPDKAPFVQKVFELYSTGLYSIEAVIDNLYKDGIIYQPSKPRIGKTQLHSILKNQIYAGWIPYQGELFPARHTPLVTNELWEKAQDPLGKKSKVYKLQQKSFLFRDALTCGSCGSVMSGEQKQGGKYIYYRCWQSANRKCDEPYVSEKVISAEITRVIERIQFPDDYQSTMLWMIKEFDETKNNTSSAEKARINKQITQLKTALKKAYWDRTQGIITQDLYADIQADYADQIETYNAALAKVDMAEAKYYNRALEYFELPKIIAGTWLHGSNEEKASLVKFFTSKILVKSKKAVVELASPFDHFYNNMILTENGRKYPQIDVLITTISLHADALEAIFVKLAA